MDTFQTVWVVAKVKLKYHPGGEDIGPISYPVVEIENLGFSDKSYADKRAKHINELDDAGWAATVWPITLGESMVSNTPVPWWPRGAVTTSRGPELVAYYASSRPLKQVVSDSWLSWRRQQAGLGNLDEAGQEPPDSLLAPLEAADAQSEQYQLQLPGI